MRTLRGHVPAAVARFHLHPVGNLSGSKRLNLAIGLPLRNQPTLAELLRQLYDPASGHYHHFLTPAQFTEQFGPSAQEYQAVLDFTGTNGLVVTATHSDRLLLDVSGTVADVERTFHLTLRLYRHPMENRVFYAPDTEPSAPAEVPILDISGLDNFARPRPLLKVIPRSEAGARPAAGSGPFGDFIGKDFRAAYAPDVLLDGAGESVGLVEFDGFYSNDIASYEGQAGLPEVPLQTVLLDGVSGSPGSGNVEVALDIEMAISMAPGLSQVVVFEGNTANDILNAMAASNQIKQLSSSWTWGGGPSATTDNIFRKMAAQGQSFFQASGDGDAYDQTIDQSGQVNEPVDSPYLTSVGGTTLTTSGTGGSWTSETAWNWGYDSSANPPGYVGTGGGISTYYSIPTWQAGLDMSGNQGSTANRNLPDVALTADNIFVEA
ncbi:MAG: peptidase S53, partial [Verrucomicrobia bacterium]|nr:peptidase S53 [Verrucomicrobiota bacterium]